MLCSPENLCDMPTIIFYDANNDNHVTLKICLLRFQDNLHYTLCISPSVKYLSDRKIACPKDPIDPSYHLTFAILANHLASRLYCIALCNYVISTSVKYLSDSKIACSIDPSDICHEQMKKLTLRKNVRKTLHSMRMDVIVRHLTNICQMVNIFYHRIDCTLTKISHILSDVKSICGIGTLHM